MEDDVLACAKEHGYVPDGCYLDGFVVMYEKIAKRDPCAGCNLDRNRCGGRQKRKHGYRKRRTAYNSASLQAPGGPASVAPQVV